MIDLNYDITIGGPDMELWMEVRIDSEVEVEWRKCDSLLTNFLEMMRANACGEYLYDNDTSAAFFAHGTISAPHYNQNISNASSAGGGETTITTSTTTYMGTSYMPVGTKVALKGFTGDWAALNGVHTVTSNVTSTTFNIAVDSSLFAAYSASGYEAFIPAGTVRWGNQYPNLNMYRYPILELGRGTAAVDIEDQWLQDHIFGNDALSKGTTTIAPLAFDDTANKVVLTMTRDFTNNSGATVNVGEAGILTTFNEIYSSSNIYGWQIIARDLVSFAIPDGSTATVNYRIFTQLGAEGGFTEFMMKNLYSGLATVTYQDQTTINGVTTNDMSSSANPRWMFAAPPGDTSLAGAPSGFRGHQVGPQVGTGNTAMTRSDYQLESKINHGTGYGELRIYGSLVDNLNINAGAGESSFEISRMFENVDGSAYQKVLTVTGTSGTTLRVDIDGTDYDEAWDTNADTTAANWVATHAATLSGLTNPITATDTGVGIITLVAERDITVTDQSIGGDLAFSQVASRPPITVNEIGLYGAMNTPSYGLAWQYARFVLTTPVDIDVGEILKLTFTIKVAE